MAIAQWRPIGRLQSMGWRSILFTSLQLFVTIIACNSVLFKLVLLLSETLKIWRLAFYKLYKLIAELEHMTYPKSIRLDLWANNSSVNSNYNYIRSKSDIDCSCDEFSPISSLINYWRPGLFFKQPNRKRLSPGFLSRGSIRKRISKLKTNRSKIFPFLELSINLEKPHIFVEKNWSSVFC